MSRRGSGTRRSTENTAAASVGEVIAPSSTASCQLSPSTKWPNSAITSTLTATPIVASETPSRITGRISGQGVVRPPSARISISAAKPERMGHLGVVEVQPEPGLAERHAHQQVDQQAGQPGTDAEPHGQDRQQQHARADQQDLVERVDVECHRGTSAVGGRRLCSLWRVGDVSRARYPPVYWTRGSGAAR